VRRRDHALIAGTGRAGTSFLVRFLAACGLDTGDAPWFERARAGLEHRIDPFDPDLPYVVKDPLLSRYCEQLDLGSLTVDALIVPLRELSAAARSRVLQERLALTETPLRAEEDVDVLASTPGGVLYSLNEVDQERLLAVGFHRLLRWAVANDLPLFLLEFPRIVEDCDHLVDTLAPWLEAHCDLDRARTAFAEVASLEAVRVRPTTAGSGRRVEQDIDRLALVERIDELTRELDEVRRRPPGGPRWLSDDVLDVGGTEFLITSDVARYMEIESTPDRFVVAKQTWMVDRLMAIIAQLRAERIVDLGIFKGGSVALAAALTHPQRLTAIELEPEPVPALEQFIAARGLSGVVRTHYGVDQGDAERLAALIADDFGEDRLDLVIDDASHLLRETRTSFELLFGRLRPGGLYLIEDWGWAHFAEPLWQSGGGWFHERPAMTNLIVELTMTAATSAALVSRIETLRDTVIVERGPLEVEGPLRLEDYYCNRGLPFRPLL
jgi:predicted O-methyltransferase YrrM